MKSIRLLLLSALTFSILLGNGCATTSSSSAANEFVGTWSAKDTEGDLFNIVIYADGTAITNWSKGESGAKGEFGRWTLSGNTITITYDDGWCDVISKKGSGYYKNSYGPGASPNAKPTNQGPAKRVTGKITPFVGVWETTAVENETPFFIALKSNGTAAKTIDPKSSGKWKLVDGCAVSTWSDGWTDRICIGKDGATNEAWKPGAPVSGPATGKHRANMVGND
jgi:hypothetical protein